MFVRKMVLVCIFILSCTNPVLADSRNNLVMLPVSVPELLTCKWWNDAKGSKAQVDMSMMALGFLKGYAAGKQGLKEFDFTITEGLFALGDAWTRIKIDEFCEKKPHDAWVNYLNIAIKPIDPSNPPPPPPGICTKRYRHDGTLIEMQKFNQGTKQWESCN